jgi:hypothetical protein
LARRPFEVFARFCWVRSPPPLPSAPGPSRTGSGQVDLKAQVQPITRSILKVELTITPDFEFNPEIHGSGYVRGIGAFPLPFPPPPQCAGSFPGDPAFNP